VCVCVQDANEKQPIEHATTIESIAFFNVRKNKKIKKWKINLTTAGPGSTQDAEEKKRQRGARNGGEESCVEGKKNGQNKNEMTTTGLKKRNNKLLFFAVG